MSYTKKAGVKEFFIALAITALLGTIGSYISFVLPSYKVLGHIAGIVLIVIYGYFVLTRYCAVFNYNIGEDYIKAERTIGGRHSEKRCPYKDICSVSRTIQPGIRVHNYTRFIKNRKNVIYIILKNDKRAAVMIENDTDLDILSVLNKKIKEGKHRKERLMK